jgi:hypothetical protein
MMLNLPRPTLMTSDNIAEEIATLDAIAKWAKRRWIKIGRDDPDRQKPRIDAALIDDVRDCISSFVEVKGCGYRFETTDRRGWATGMRKLTNLRNFRAMVQVPVYYGVSFACGTIAAIEVMTRPHEIIAGFGRTDRGQGSADLEPGALFAWEQFHKIMGGTV